VKWQDTPPESGSYMMREIYTLFGKITKYFPIDETNESMGK